jgi:hypothetical protein
MVWVWVSLGASQRRGEKVNGTWTNLTLYVAWLESSAQENCPSLCPSPNTVDGLLGSGHRRYAVLLAYRDPENESTAAPLFPISSLERVVAIYHLTESGL